LKILLLGHQEIYSALALNLLMDRLAGHELCLWLSGPLKEQGSAPSLVQFDRHEAAMCEQLPCGPFVGFEALAEKTGKALGSLLDPNSSAGLAALEALQPDLILSVRYRKIIKNQAIAIPRYGILNIHSGLLPENRGAMATFYAMLRGGKTIGSTLHYIVDESIDTGPIVGLAPIPLNYHWSYSLNVMHLYRPGCEMIIQAVNDIDQYGRAPSQLQQGAGHYHNFPMDEDFVAFSKAGFRLHDRDDVQRFTEHYVQNNLIGSG